MIPGLGPIINQNIMTFNEESNKSEFWNAWNDCSCGFVMAHGERKIRVNLSESGGRSRTPGLNEYQAILNYSVLHDSHQMSEEHYLTPFGSCTVERVRQYWTAAGESSIARLQLESFLERGLGKVGQYEGSRFGDMPDSGNDVQLTRTFVHTELHSVALVSN